MQQSHWHLEMYAREVQQRREREAEIARQLLDAGLPRGAASPRGLLARVGQTVARVRQGMWTSQATTAGRQPSPVVNPGNALAAAAPAAPPSVGPRRLSRHTDPYAGMAIVARGQAFLSVEEPSGVRDC